MWKSIVFYYPKNNFFLILRSFSCHIFTVFISGVFLSIPYFVHYGVKYPNYNFRSSVDGALLVGIALISPLLLRNVLDCVLHDVGGTSIYSNHFSKGLSMSSIFICFLITMNLKSIVLFPLLFGVLRLVLMLCLLTILKNYLSTVWTPSVISSLLVLFGTSQILVISGMFIGSHALRIVFYSIGCVLSLFFLLVAIIRIFITLKKFYLQGKNQYSPENIKALAVLFVNILIIFLLITYLIIMSGILPITGISDKYPIPLYTSEIYTLSISMVTILTLNDYVVICRNHALQMSPSTDATSTVARYLSHHLRSPLNAVHLGLLCLKTIRAEEEMRKNSISTVKTFDDHHHHHQQQQHHQDQGHYESNTKSSGIYSPVLHHSSKLYGPQESGAQGVLNKSDISMTVEGISQDIPSAKVQLDTSDVVEDVDSSSTSMATPLVGKGIPKLVSDIPEVNLDVSLDVNVNKSILQKHEDYMPVVNSIINDDHYDYGSHSVSRPHPSTASPIAIPSSVLSEFYFREPKSIDTLLQHDQHSEHKHHHFEPDSHQKREENYEHKDTLGIDGVNHIRRHSNDMIELIEDGLMACAEMVKILDNIVTYDSILKKTLAIYPRCIAASNFVESTLEPFYNLAGKQGIHIKISQSVMEGINVSTACMNIDAVRMSQVIGTLMSNAIKYTKRRGHITVRVEYVYDNIRRSHRAPITYIIRRGPPSPDTSSGALTRLRLVITDSGRGIPKHLLAGIFENTIQFVPGQEEEKQGSGLSLWISHRLATLHEGCSLTVESGGEGKGTTFVLSIPLFPSESSMRLSVSDIGGIRIRKILAKVPTLLTLSSPFEGYDSPKIRSPFRNVNIPNLIGGVMSRKSSHSQSSVNNGHPAKVVISNNVLDESSHASFLYGTTHFDGAQLEAGELSPGPRPSTEKAMKSPRDISYPLWTPAIDPLSLSLDGNKKKREEHMAATPITSNSNGSSPIYRNQIKLPPPSRRSTSLLFHRKPWSNISRNNSVSEFAYNRDELGGYRSASNVQDFHYDRDSVLQEKDEDHDEPSMSLRKMIGLEQQPVSPNNASLNMSQEDTEIKSKRKPPSSPMQLQKLIKIPRDDSTYLIRRQISKILYSNESLSKAGADDKPEADRQGSLILSNVRMNKSISNESLTTHPNEMDPTIAPTNGFHILVVDDAPLNRKMMVRVLRGRCTSILEAEHGQSAVDLMRQIIENKGVLDFVLMDYQMPVMNGPLAAKEMRKLGYKGPIIGVTGNAVLVDLETFLQNGADTVLTKPLDIRSLEESLAEHGINLSRTI